MVQNAVVLYILTYINVLGATASDHFLKLRCGKIARRCSDLEVKMYKTPQGRTAFGSCDVGKLHAAVARNTQNTAGSDHFLKLRCGKIARRCSEKHILKSKSRKHSILGPLFEVAMWKNCTPL